MAPPVPRRQQPVEGLEYQIAFGTHPQERIEHDCIGAAIGVQEHPCLFLVVGGEGRRVRRLGHPVLEQPLDLVVLRGVGQHWPQPGCDVELLAVGIVEDAGRLGRVAITGEPAHVQCVGPDRPFRPLAVPRGDVVFDVGEVPECIGQGPLPDDDAFVAGEHQRVGRLHRVVRDRVAPPAPVGEAAVIVLHRCEAVDVVVDHRAQLVGRRELLGIERLQDLVEGHDGDDP